MNTRCSNVKFSEVKIDNVEISCRIMREIKAGLFGYFTRTENLPKPRCYAVRLIAWLDSLISAVRGFKAKLF
jgi:hypothetical protein